MNQEHMSHNGHDHHSHNPLAVSAHATLHCLIGCMIGDAIGAALGVTLGLGTAVTIGLAIIFAYIAGFGLAMVPLVRHLDLSVREAMRVVWLGEAVSIAAMEIVINAVDYAMGGIQASAITEPTFWIGLAVAAPVAFFAAWPVNHWLLKKEIKTHH